MVASGSAAAGSAQRQLDLAAYLKDRLDASAEFTLDVATAAVPSYAADAARRPDGSLVPKTRELESLRRQFRRDLDDLKERFGIDVAYDEHHHVYRVKPPFFTTAERQALIAAAAIASVDDTRDRDTAEIGGAVDARGHEVFLKVDDAVRLFRDAIVARAVIGFRHNHRDRQLEPYGLAYRDDHWYVGGFDRAADGPRAFRFDRIEMQDGRLALHTVEPGPAYDIPPGFDPSTLFRFDPDVWGSDPPVTARVEVDADLAWRFAIVVDGHIVAEDEHAAIVEAHVRNYAVFRDRVLGFRSAARVIEPPELVAAITDWLHQIAAASA
jgi:predicted DNA-binding transcriptional regulator YafY